MGRHRRNQYLALGPSPGCEAMACSTSRIKTQSSSAKMDEPHRCASLWKAACKQQIVLSRKTATQDREGKLSRGVWGGSSWDGLGSLQKAVSGSQCFRTVMKCLFD